MFDAAVLKKSLAYFLAHSVYDIVAVWLTGNSAGRINEVAVHRAGLVLRCVTVGR